MTSILGAPARLQRQALRDDVYDHLLEMLMEARLSPGVSLSIDGLSRELGVSPTPVREALVLLEHTGLVARSARKGYRVAEPLSPQQLDNLFDARRVIEVAAMERSVTSTAERLPDLLSAHESHVSAARLIGESSRDNGLPTPRATRLYFEADWQFHLVLVNAAGNPFLTQMLRGLGAHLHRMMQSPGRGVNDCEAALGEHEAVVNAVQSADHRQALVALERHLVRAQQRALKDAVARPQERT